MLTSDRRTADLTTAGRLRTQHAVVGIDGGGSKTEAVIMDAHQQVIGEGLAGASIPCASVLPTRRPRSGKQSTKLASWLR
jgi:hypothetical protein